MAAPAPYVPALVQTAYTRAELIAFVGQAYADLAHLTQFRAVDIDTEYTRMPFQRAILGLRDQVILFDTVQVLTDAATIAWNMDSGRNATVTLGGNRTLGAPSNIVAGASGVLLITQDGTGSRTLAYNAVWKWAVGAPVLQTAAGAVDVLYWWSPDGTNLYAELRADTINLLPKVQVLTDAATVALDLSKGCNAKVTLGGNRTLGAPSAGIAGASGFLTITQDGTGSRTLAYNAVWKFSVGAPTLSTTAGAIDVLRWYTPDGTNFYAWLLSRADGDEYLSSLVASGAHVALTTTATVYNVTSKTLTQGTWDVEGCVNFDLTTAAVTELQAAINNVSATLPTDGTEEYGAPLIAAQTYKNSVAIQRKRFVVADGATTTVYLIAKATFTGAYATAFGFGQLTARRVQRGE